jgi:predicted  nucleic acid-binding Zn-ribbon protein
MNELLKNLVRLQALEFGELKDKDAKAIIAELRAKIPAQILLHYDRLAVRRKKGIVAVHNQVCSGCHMKLPIGVIATLMQERDIQLCDSCGRYLYLPEPVPAPAEPAAEPAPVKRKKKRQAAAVPA